MGKIDKAFWKEIKAPSDTIRAYYEDQYLRNQKKWMRRSMLEPDQLGIEFDGDGQKYKLVGTATPKEMVAECLEDGRFYMVHSDEITSLVLGIKKKK